MPVAPDAAPQVPTLSPEQWQQAAENGIGWHSSAHQLQGNPVLLSVPGLGNTGLTETLSDPLPNPIPNGEPITHIVGVDLVEIVAEQKELGNDVESNSAELTALVEATLIHEGFHVHGLGGGNDWGNAEHAAIAYSTSQRLCDKVGDIDAVLGEEPSELSPEEREELEGQREGYCGAVDKLKGPFGPANLGRLDDINEEGPDSERESVDVSPATYPPAVPGGYHWGDSEADPPVEPNLPFACPACDD